MTKDYDAVRHEGMRQYGFGIDAMKTIKVCIQCGAMSDSSWKVCEECGAQLPEDTLFERYQRRHRHCLLCGTVVAKNTLYCPKCGQRLEVNYGK